MLVFRAQPQSVGRRLHGGLVLVCFALLCLVLPGACFPAFDGCKADQDCPQNYPHCVATLCMACEGEACVAAPDGMRQDASAGDIPQTQETPDRSPDQSIDTPASTGCASDAECPGTQRCSNKRCEWISCKADTDCPTDMICDSGRGHCRYKKCHPTKLLKSWTNGNGRLPFVFLSKTELAFSRGTNNLEVWDIVAGRNLRPPSPTVLLEVLSDTQRKSGQFLALALRLQPFTLYATHSSGVVVKWSRDANGWGPGALVVDAAFIKKHETRPFHSIAVQPDHEGKRGVLAVSSPDGRVLLLHTDEPTTQVTPLVGFGPFDDGGSPNKLYAFRGTCNKPEVCGNGGTGVFLEYIRFSSGGQLLGVKPSDYQNGVQLNSGLRIWDVRDTKKPQYLCHNGNKVGFAFSFHPTLPTRMAYAPSSTSLRLFDLKLTPSCSLGQDVVRSLRPPDEAKLLRWRAAAFHPEGHTVAAIGEEKRSGYDYRFVYFIDEASGSGLARQEVTMPRDKYFWSGNKFNEIAYNPWDPSYMAATLYSPSLLVLMGCP